MSLYFHAQLSCNFIYTLRLSFFFFCALLHYTHISLSCLTRAIRPVLLASVPSLQQLYSGPTMNNRANSRTMPPFCSLLLFYALFEPKKQDILLYAEGSTHFHRHACISAYADSSSRCIMLESVCQRLCM